MQVHTFGRTLMFILASVYLCAGASTETIFKIQASLSSIKLNSTDSERLESSTHSRTVDESSSYIPFSAASSDLASQIPSTDALSSASVSEPSSVFALQMSGIDASPIFASASDLKASATFASQIPSIDASASVLVLSTKSPVSSILVSQIPGAGVLVSSAISSSIPPSQKPTLDASASSVYTSPISGIGTYLSESFSNASLFFTSQTKDIDASATASTASSNENKLDVSKLTILNHSLKPSSNKMSSVATEHSVLPTISPSSSSLPTSPPRDHDQHHFHGHTDEDIIVISILLGICGLSVLIPMGFIIFTLTLRKRK